MSSYYDIVCKKLADYVHGTDPAPLADYIVIQLEAGVPKDTFTSDLVDFLGENAGEFVEWLFDVVHQPAPPSQLADGGDANLKTADDPAPSEHAEPAVRTHSVRSTVEVSESHDRSKSHRRRAPIAWDMEASGGQSSKHDERQARSNEHGKDRHQSDPRRDERRTNGATTRHDDGRRSSRDEHADRSTRGKARSPSARDQQQQQRTSEARPTSTSAAAPPANLFKHAMRSTAAAEDARAPFAASTAKEEQPRRRPDAAAAAKQEPRSREEAAVSVPAAGRAAAAPSAALAGRASEGAAATASGRGRSSVFDRLGKESGGPPPAAAPAAAAAGGDSRAGSVFSRLQGVGQPNQQLRNGASRSDAAAAPQQRGITGAKRPAPAAAGPPSSSAAANGAAGATVAKRRAVVLTEQQLLEQKMAKMKAEIARLQAATAAAPMPASWAPLQRPAAPVSSLNPKLDADRRSIVVKNVDLRCTKEVLIAHFGGCGKIARATLPLDPFSGAPRGYGYVEFVEEGSVAAALELTGSVLLGQSVAVSRKDMPVQLGGRGGAMGVGGMGLGLGGPLPSVQMGTRNLVWKREEGTLAQ